MGLRMKSPVASCDEEVLACPNKFGVLALWQRCSLH